MSNEVSNLVSNMESSTMPEMVSNIMSDVVLHGIWAHYLCTICALLAHYCHPWGS